MTIRRMTLADVDQVHAIELATFPVPWSRQSLVDEMERNVCARYLVAVDDAGSILAYAGAWIIFDEAHVTNVAVAQTHRGQGIGKQIMLALMQYAANLGADYLTLEVRRSNTVAQALYKKLGFMELAVRKRYYEDNGEDALLLVCDHMPPVEADFSEA
ncbi:MAG: ribosomal protein S18-alanine N-acetyltransferase [Candidatus Limiplasma sp.]|nr:ribosomal protein S18-alanine N-acetyltransferase [Candidatus Limiplasma sp.]